mmetsp:Transcript_8789/g.11603  ORF Transcript_8789/g.11603 Transcript_8789/m.11603 type:complete len:371 (+) Transcript_8789:51-1163(+)|eukprot:CAMPEP_0117757054 /NCGR_PEP_ID=MMETSP0947-20121206/14483_1 /TAXON_ID=44440 /ORGANISM="Chattonella subsalsa, Strain CCMP2191" /LENGTH=370 /DNA_ID=CAMNT_0005576835 /DNA_START=48 /DNA_END=1160 /DNA_ORIENTATION=+
MTARSIYFLLGIVTITKVYAFLTPFTLQKNDFSMTKISSASVSNLKMAVWSDYGTTKDYMSKIGQPEQELPGDCPSTIVGANGRIGNLLASVSPQDTLLGRGDTIPADGTGPIYVCTRNDALDGIIDSCPENRKEDLVFMQNGLIEYYLKRKGLESNTQALLYFAVAKKGDRPIDGIIPSTPEGLTAATGKWANAFKERLEKCNLKCEVMAYKEYRKAMFEKLIWISSFMLVGAAEGCETVGETIEKHPELLEELITELKGAISCRTAVLFGNGMIQRLAEYSVAVAHFPIGVKEWEWRNGYFWAISRNQVKTSKPGMMGHPDRYGKREELPYGEAADKLPLHTALCKKCKENGAITFDLPEDEGGVLLY